jgi:hypothetical protein
MNAVSKLRNLIDYVISGAARTFSPNQDEYPSTGVQPFEGEIDRKKHRRRFEW